MVRLILTPFLAGVVLWTLFGLPPRSDSAEVTELLRLNSRGVAFMEQLDYKAAGNEFSRLLELDPNFVPGHVNLGVALFNQQLHEEAARSFRTALELDPGQIQSHYMMGLIYRNQDQAAKAAEAFGQVARQDPQDPSTQYYLGLLSSRGRRYEEAIGHFRRVLSLEPYNASAHYNLAIALTRSGQAEEGRVEMERFRTLQGMFGATTLGLQYLEQGRYALVLEDLDDYLPQPPAESREEFVVRFRENGAAAGLSFRHEGPGKAVSEVSSVQELEDGLVPWVGSGSSFGDYDGDGHDDLFLANAGPGGSRSSLFRNRGDGTFQETSRESGLEWKGRTMHGVWGDYDNDRDLDLYLINYGPNVLYRNEGGGRFLDVTEQAGVGDPAWGSGGAFVDYDHDGDLDLLVTNLTAPPESLKPGTRFPQDFPGANNSLFRNNSDGTFTDVSESSGLAGEQRQTWSSVCTDFDNRRDIDFLFVNRGAPNQLFSNQRDGTFVDLAEAAGVTGAGEGVGVGIGDLAHRGVLDLVLPALSGSDIDLWTKKARNRRYARRQDWMPENWKIPGQVHTAHLLDFDNDGDRDLLLVSAPLFTSSGEDPRRNFHLLANHRGRFRDVSRQARLDEFRGLPVRGVSAADYDRDGDLDLVANVNGGPPLLLQNQGGNRHHWVSVTARGTNSNRSGIGTKVEVRSGRLLQKGEVRGGYGFLSQNSATLHFGLGRRQGIDIVRLLWPGGVLQSELNQQVNQALEIQELDRKGTSCPILYVWNGERYVFQTDFLGGSAYGYLLAPGTFNYPDTDEYVKLNRSQVGLKDGRLAITLNNQLEELILFDQLEVVVVDHPEDYEIYPDEKLLPGPPYAGFRILTFSDPRPPLSATDGRGRDLLPALSKLDGEYPDLFRNLPFKGYAESHDLILDLGPVSGENSRLLLDAWIDYADSTSNLAASQAGLSLSPPVLQVQDANGVWVTVIERMGFPAGLPKPMTVDLSGKFLSDSRKVRIRTNMRIHWDRIRVDASPPRRDFRTYRLRPQRADLHYLGFPAGIGKPLLGYDRSQILPTAPWKAHIGNYTRFGEVSPLLLERDDMFVATRAGDEIEAFFDLDRIPPPPEGWVRDFLVYVDGFGKDMDLHSASPDTVGPLPFHGMSRFPYGPNERYPDTPAHQRYLQEWNTRRVDRWY